MRRLQLRPKQAVGYANRSAPNSDQVSGHNIAKSFIEVEAVVVGQFTFHHYISMYAVAEAPAYSEVVRTGFRDAQVIKKCAHFKTLLRERRRRTSVYQQR